jgi:methionyl-tRNA formyltransferase
MKEVIIISDNPELTKVFKKYYKEFFTKNPEVFFTGLVVESTQMIELGGKHINLHLDKDLDKLLSQDKTILSLHCKSIFPSRLVSEALCLNLHPGFNPINRGWYPQVFSIINSESIGATLHVMTQEIDGGPIIDQAPVVINPEDTSLDVYRRVIALEIELLKKNFHNIVYRDFEAREIPIIGNYNSKSDFAKLCELNLESIDSFGNHLNLLRALTHGDFKNAFFVVGNQKYFVKVLIEKESQD